MNYGRSIRGKEAIERGEAPASVAAGWIGSGCTARWIAQFCVADSWHHSNVQRTANGSPCDYFDSNRVLARWLLANFAARHHDKAAARRLPALFALAKKWHVAFFEATRENCGETLEPEDVAELLAELPPTRAAKPKVEVESLGKVRLTKREYKRNRGAYRACEATCTIGGAAYKGDWLIWTRELGRLGVKDEHGQWNYVEVWIEKKGRCKRDSIVKLEATEEREHACC